MRSDDKNYTEVDFSSEISGLFETAVNGIQTVQQSVRPRRNVKPIQVVSFLIFIATSLKNLILF